jgi:hypothetical protein
MRLNSLGEQAGYSRGIAAYVSVYVQVYCIGFHCLSLHVSAYIAIFMCVGYFIFICLKNSASLLSFCLFFTSSHSACFNLCFYCFPSLFLLFPCVCLFVCLLFLFKIVSANHTQIREWFTPAEEQPWLVCCENNL